jgi:hypothetical protein
MNIATAPMPNEADEKTAMLRWAGVQLADQFRNNFSPAETIVILMRTLDQVCAWLPGEDIGEVLDAFRKLLDDIEKRRTTLH